MRIKWRALTTIILLSLVNQNASPQTQGELNDQACLKYKKADAEMNSIYKQILDSYKSEAVFVAKLKTAQRAWVAFRDAHLESLYPEPNKLQSYGSVNPMCQCIVLAELTTERTKALRQWLRGIPEGDVCSGSVRIKNQ